MRCHRGNCARWSLPSIGLCAPHTKEALDRLSGMSQHMAKKLHQANMTVQQLRTLLQLADGVTPAIPPRCAKCRVTLNTGQHVRVGKHLLCESCEAERRGFGLSMPEFLRYWQSKSATKEALG